MCSERSSLVNLGCKWQLSQEARRSVQLSQLCAKVQCAAENLGFTLHDTATGRTAISTLRATDEAVDGIGKAVVAGKSQIENGSEHGRPSDGDRPPRSSRGGNAEMENPSSEHAESIKRLGPWQWLGSQGRPISLFHEYAKTLNIKHKNDARTDSYNAVSKSDTLTQAYQIIEFYIGKYEKTTDL